MNISPTLLVSEVSGLEGPNRTFPPAFGVEKEKKPNHRPTPHSATASGRGQFHGRLRHWQYLPFSPL